MTWGLLPKEYNVKVHGSYFPGRYYGTPDTPFQDVKLGEMKQWLSRRSKNPVDWAKAVGRFAWRWNYKWLMPKNTTMAPALQILTFVAFCRYVQDYDHHKQERHAKYH